MKEEVPKMDHVPHDIMMEFAAFCWAKKSEGALTKDLMAKAFKTANEKVRRRDLSFSLRGLTKDCMGDCSPRTRELIREVLAEFDALDKETAK